MPGNIGRRIGLLLLLATGWWGGNDRLSAAEPEVGVEATKAALLLKISEFTTWPASSRPAGGGGLKIGFFHAPDLLTAARRLVKGDEVNQFELVDVSAAGGLEACHVVYFGRWDHQTGDMLERLRLLPVLTMGEGESFVRAQGIVGFEFLKQRDKFQPGYHINVEAMDRARILLDPRVLKRRLNREREP